MCCSNWLGEKAWSVLFVFITVSVLAGVVGEASSGIECLTPEEERVAGTPIQFDATWEVGYPRTWRVRRYGSISYLDIELVSDSGVYTAVFPEPGDFVVECHSVDWRGTSTVHRVGVTILPADDLSTAPPEMTTASRNYFEDFSNAEAWSEGSNAEYTWGTTSGKYAIAVRKELWNKWSWAPYESFDLDDVTMAVDISLTAESNGFGGIIWGTDNENYYKFSVDGDGRCCCSWQKDDEWEPARIPWTEHSAIKQAPATNRLQITVRDDFIILSVNGVVIETLEGNLHHEGRIGLAVGTFSGSEPFSEAHFDSLSVQPAPENLAPKATFTYEGSGSSGRDILAGKSVRFVASESSDPDGTIVEYAWDWDGDGTYDRRHQVPYIFHAFDRAGRYTVKLQVTDNEGSTDTMSHTIVVEEANASPIAGFTWQAVSSDGSRLVVEPRSGDRIEFNASASSDPDGEIVEYAWDWDADDSYDLTTSGPVTAHSFDTGGSHRVRLLVLDDQGAMDSVTNTVTIRENQPPSAGFGVSPAQPSILDEVAFTDTSTDADGRVASWDWNFGDGSDSTEQHPTHRYNVKKTFNVSLTVTDDEGQTDTVLQQLTIVNRSPEAAFALHPDTGRAHQAIQADASASFDPDGDIVKYNWDFDGDSAPDATGRAAEWSYAEPGTYTVALTVTDSDGATAKTEHLITIEAAAQIIEPERIWAVVIGVSDYLHVKDLQYARADAEAFTVWLLDANVDPQHIVLLLDEEGTWPQLQSIASELATMTKVRAALDWLRRMARPDDLVFVFFAGHGYQGEDDNGDEADGVDEFLVLYDTEKTALEATSLRDDEFGRFLDRVESEHVMVVFDSCHSGGQSRSLSGGTRPLGDGFDLFNDFSLEGKLVLAAAREDQEALEHDQLGHGLFTHFLLRGLQGEADLNLDYRITAEELHSYVSAEVEEFARRERGRIQTPELTGRGSVGIVLSHTNQPPIAGFTVAPRRPYAYGATRFFSTSTDDDEIVRWTWSFGDGGTANTPEATHVYDAADTYAVVLTTADREGLESTVQQEITVREPGSVTALADDRVIISLGTDHGLQPGEQLEVFRRFVLSDGTAVDERKGTLEVIAPLASDRTECRIVDAQIPIELGDIVRPVAAYDE